MSEQPQHQQPEQEYSVPSYDGTARMDAGTDVWLKASDLPLKRASVEPMRPKTEAELIAERVRQAGAKLIDLKAARDNATRIEDKPFLKDGPDMRSAA